MMRSAGAAELVGEFRAERGADIMLRTIDRSDHHAIGVLLVGVMQAQFAV